MLLYLPPLVVLLFYATNVSCICTSTGSIVTGFEVLGGTLQPAFQPGISMGGLSINGDFYTVANMPAGSTQLQFIMKIDSYAQQTFFVDGVNSTFNSGQVSTVSLIPGKINTVSIWAVGNFRIAPCRKYIYLTIDVPPVSSSSGAVIGDPQFTGLRGQEFQVHGVPGNVYALISTPHLQYNAQFVFLKQGQCPPALDSKKGCWTHPGTYLGSLGFRDTNDNRILIESGPAKEGFTSITVNGKQIAEGEVITLTTDKNTKWKHTAFVSQNSSHVCTIQIDNYRLEIENQDNFVNQRVQVLDWASLRGHGLLGQTWKHKTLKKKTASLKDVIDGAVDDYVIAGNDLFGIEFVYSQFE